jgi:hypothetical protein
MLSSFRIVESGTSRSVTGSLVLPADNDTVEILFRESYAMNKITKNNQK